MPRGQHRGVLPAFSCATLPNLIFNEPMSPIGGPCSSWPALAASIGQFGNHSRLPLCTGQRTLSVYDYSQVVFCNFRLCVPSRSRTSGVCWAMSSSLPSPWLWPCTTTARDKQGKLGKVGKGYRGCLARKNREKKCCSSAAFLHYSHSWGYSGNVVLPLSEKPPGARSER